MGLDNSTHRIILELQRIKDALVNGTLSVDINESVSLVPTSSLTYTFTATNTTTNIGNTWATAGAEKVRIVMEHTTDATVKMRYNEYETFAAGAKANQAFLRDGDVLELTGNSAIDLFHWHDDDANIVMHVTTYA